MLIRLGGFVTLLPHRRPRHTVIAILALTCALSAGGVAAGAGAQAAATHRVSAAPSRQTVPVYSYQNAIRESVWVDTPLDNDHDGRPDQVAVDLEHPREAAAAGTKVPVIMDASPYYACCGRGNESEKKQYAADGTVTKFPLFYDNYFVPRGYAFAAVDLAGTSRSTGCEDVGGPEEVQAAKAVVDWLGGRAKAFHADGSPAVADWTTGKVGMIGKSWDGTIANGVAATGVPNLVTIVPISAISSWYDYERSNGVIYWPGSMPWLSGLVTGRPAGVCEANLAALTTDSADATGDYNAFWRDRDYLSRAAHVRASVFAYHGLNDLNVETKHIGRWWAALGAHGVPRKLWLSQTGHVDPFDVRRPVWVEELHRWFDFWLQGMRNGVMTEPAVSIERSAGQWVDESSWPASSARTLPLPLGPGDGSTGTIGAAPSADRYRTIVDNADPNVTEDIVAGDPNQARPWRQVFLTPSLPAAVRISGTPTVTVRVQVDKPTTELTARLVDYGSASRVDSLGPGEGIETLATESCWGSSTATDDACYLDTREVVATREVAVLTRGWLDAAHRASLTDPEPLQPGRWYTITVPLRPQDQILARGHVLGLVVTLSDAYFTSPSVTGATVRLDLAGSRLNLPVTLAGTGAVAPTVQQSLGLGSARAFRPPHVSARPQGQVQLGSAPRYHRLPEFH